MLIMKKAIDYIAAHYQEENLDRDTVAGHIFMNPNYFSTLFKKETGTSFVEYLNNYRINKAEELLKSRLFVYPSHAASKFEFFAETFCIAALEAQTAGTPVVASARGALNETVVNGGTGVLINGDPFSAEFQSEFARVAVNLLKDPVRWDQMSSAGQKWARDNFRWGDIAREWENKFRILLSKKGK